MRVLPAVLCAGAAGRQQLLLGDGVLQRCVQGCPSNSTGSSRARCCSRRCSAKRAPVWGPAKAASLASSSWSATLNRFMVQPGRWHPVGWSNRLCSMFWPALQVVRSLTRSFAVVTCQRRWRQRRPGSCSASWRMRTPSTSSTGESMLHATTVLQLAPCILMLSQRLCRPGCPCRLAKLHTSSQGTS